MAKPKNEDKLPRYSYDLVKALDKTYPPPQPLMSPEQWEKMDTGMLCRNAFSAGQRSVVEGLLSLIDEDDQDGNPTPTPNDTLDDAGGDEAAPGDDAQVSYRVLGTPRLDNLRSR